MLHIRRDAGSCHLANMRLFLSENTEVCFVAYFSNILSMLRLDAVVFISLFYDASLSGFTKVYFFDAVE